MKMKNIVFTLMSVIMLVAIGFRADCGGNPQQTNTAAAKRTVDSRQLRVGINADCSDLGPWSAGSNGQIKRLLQPDRKSQLLGTIDPLNKAAYRYHIPCPADVPRGKHLKAGGKKNNAPEGQMLPRN